MINPHSFHIPVMGIGFTVDTPLKVSRFGIDSVISLSDDILLEKLRKMYCRKHRIVYEAITEGTEDFRAKRITAYLNLIQELAEKQFESFRQAAAEKIEDLRHYFSMLPDSSAIKQEFRRRTATCLNVREISAWVRDKLYMGSIDVNIMTKVDKPNYGKNKEKLPVEYNDAHAALRGYARSNLHSSLILSAGMNPRLYSYITHFKDFFPDDSGEIRKKIVLKVSDYRSALIQGKYLAKKGLWVSEYRIESGLNCGGHAFATDGYLLGPILAQFRDKRTELRQSVYGMLMQSIPLRERALSEDELPFRITAQGGVGTAEEHRFMMDYYQLDSVGWGTPFLLVPEVTNVDEDTMEKLSNATEHDLYLSDISPLGVPFNSLRGNSKDMEKSLLIKKGRPGSSCPKKFAALNHEFTEKGICIASRQYQHLKIKELDQESLSPAAYRRRYAQIVEKSCTCVGLGTSALLVNQLGTEKEGKGVSVCPGPNMAYFSKRMSLKDMTDHIYGRSNMLAHKKRPNMFIKELGIYMDYLKKMMRETNFSLPGAREKYLLAFAGNLKDGINYYYALFNELKGGLEQATSGALNDLDGCKRTWQKLYRELTQRNHISENADQKALLAAADNR